LSSVTKEKSFITLTPGQIFIKTFFFVIHGGTTKS
jgi:hypothetical protein